MELAYAIRHIWRHRIWLVPVSVLALIAALAVTYKIDLAPPALHSKSFQYGSASGQVLIQPEQPGALARVTASNVVSPEQAAVYASLLQSRPVRYRIGTDAKLPSSEIAIQGQAIAGTGAEEQPNAAQRSAQLIAQGRSLTLYFSLERDVPIITLYAQGPTADTARRLVVGAEEALSSYVGALQDHSGTAQWQRVKIVKLGAPEFGTLASGTETVVALLVALLVFALGCVAIVFVPRFSLAMQRAKATESGLHPPTPMPMRVAPSQETIAGNGGGHELAEGLRHLPDGE